MSFVPLGEQQEDANAVESVPTRDKVIGLINEAQMVPREKKINCLNQVKELVIKKEPDLLDSFLDEVIAFQADQSADVRKFVVTFMEDASKSDPGLLVRIIPIIAYMIEDESTVVLKRLLASIIQIYRLSLTYIAKMKVVDSDVEEMWEVLQDIKQKVCNKVESDNDGVRTIAIKFMEFLILTQTKKEPNTKFSETEISLDIIPSSHPMVNPAELREEAGTTMGALLQLTVSPTVSSVNLMTCIISLATIAKQRPSYISTVLQAFELLHANLPPHFATSQISSVRKQLKTQVLGLLRQPAAFECREQITTLLTDLGCTQADITKNAPKMPHEAMKRSRSDMDSASPSTKAMCSSARARDIPANASAGRIVGSEVGASEDKLKGSGSALIEAIELTTNDLKPLLTPEAVTELVIVNMKNVPLTQPKMFRNSYTPIAAAGTEAQVTHLARLLASQMTSAGIGVGAQVKGIKPQQIESPVSRESSPIVRDPRKRHREKNEDDEGENKRQKIKEEKEEDKDEPSLEKSMAELTYLGKLLGLPDMMDPMFPLAYATFFSSGATVGNTSRVKVENPSFIHNSNLVTIPTTPTEEDSKELAKEKEKRKLQATLPQKLKKIHKFDLSSLVRPIGRQLNRELTISSFKRILESEKSVCRGGAAQARVKLIVNLVTMFGEDFSESLLDFILEDFRTRFDIATAWLFAEYSIAEGYLQSNGQKDDDNYDKCLTGLMLGIKAKLNPRDRMFTKLVLEAPKMTPAALDIIKSYCHDEDRAFLGVSTLKELVLRRPHGPESTDDFLQALLEITISDIELVRIQVMHIAKKFYAKPELAMKIERFALQKLQLLLQDHPTFEQETMEDVEVAVDWTEASVKMCFSLFIALLPLNHKLLTDLAFVYTSTTASVKRIILRQLDQPVRSIGMKSEELLQLVENCPRGGETLIMRMLHILTEGAAPSADLVNRVRGLYQRNSSDVRFLIPVLHGLTKEEVISALPKFVRLSPGLVNGVVKRLLVSHRGDHGHSISPVSPSELLVALHNINFKNDDSLMKCVIKATNMCFQVKSVFTQEVLAVVLQQLLEQDSIPVLFMKTVLQSLSICPKLISFVMTILVKLISKQIWKQPKVLWHGFIKCCEMTKPHSFQVLMKLPSQQLESVFEQSPETRLPFYQYLQKLPPHQKTGVSRSLLKEAEAAGSEKVVKRVKSEKKRRQSSKSDRSDQQADNQENTI